MGRKDAKKSAANDSVASQGVTELMQAADRGDTAAVRRLVPEQARLQTTGKEELNGVTIRRRTALMGAAIYGHVETVRLLADYESGIKDKNGSTALMHAARLNHVEVVKVLVDHENGADDGCV